MAKIRGEYAGAGGEAEFSKSEMVSLAKWQTKNTRNLLLAIVAIFGMIMIFAWFAGKSLIEWIKSLFTTGIPEKTAKAYAEKTTTIENTLQKESGSFDRYVQGIPGGIREVIQAGIVITPSSILETAAREGADMRNDLQSTIYNVGGEKKTGAQLVDENPALKIIVGIGEGIPRTLTGGLVSPYNAGRAAGQYLRDLASKGENLLW